MNWETEWERQLERADERRELEKLGFPDYDFEPPDHPAIAALKEALLNERLNQEVLTQYRAEKNEPHPQ